LLRDTNAAPHQRAFPDLSDREYEVLTLLARDLTNQEIATELSISLKTVRNHVSNVLAKLRASSRHEAGRIARQAYMGVI
jgi:DNA-binding NarL/FixJ family response regulator